MMKIRVRILAIAPLLVLLACSSGSENALEGHWETDGGEIALHFADDGTFTSSGPAGKTRGQYRPSEDGQIEMEFEGMSALFAVEVSEDRLTFCQPNHGCERFRRAN
jgi:hypothetical protein